MTPAEAAMVLGVASSFDRRTVGEADAQAWAAAMPDVRMVDARDAVVAHYRETRDWVMPADILRRVYVMRRQRLTGITPPTPPRELADRPAAEARWVRMVRRGLGDGMAEADAVAAACDALGVPVPDVGRMVGPSPRVRQAIEQASRTMGAVE